MVSQFLNKGSRDGSREIAASDTLAQIARFCHGVPIRASVRRWMQEWACRSAALMMSRYVVALCIPWQIEECKAIMPRIAARACSNALSSRGSHWPSNVREGSIVSPWCGVQAKAFCTDGEGKSAQYLRWEIVVKARKVKEITYKSLISDEL